MAANHGSFAADNFTYAEILHLAAYLNDLPDKLMSHHQRNRDGVTRPIIPFIDMEIGAADARAFHVDQYISGTSLWLRCIFEPKTWGVFLLN